MIIDNEVNAYNITFCDANGLRKDRPNGGMYINETDKANTITSRTSGCENTIVKNSDSVTALHIMQNPITSENVTPCISAGSTAGQAAVGVMTPKAVAFDCRNNALNNEISATLQAKDEGQSLNYINPVFVNTDTEYTVRRLTPLECERLQGFPDNWTDIGTWSVEEEWTDKKRGTKKRKESADSLRYKAIGNSIALPPWVYVLQRLSLCCGGDTTMASLFDGMGGFPLIWEQLHGQGFCLWASEIEDFPIAVTKRRFSEVQGDE